MIKMSMTFLEANSQLLTQFRHLVKEDVWQTYYKKTNSQLKKIQKELSHSFQTQGMITGDRVFVTKEKAYYLIEKNEILHIYQTFIVNDIETESYYAFCVEEGSERQHERSIFHTLSIPEEQIVIPRYVDVFFLKLFNEKKTLEEGLKKIHHDQFLRDIELDHLVYEYFYDNQSQLNEKNKKAAQKAFDYGYLSII